MNDKKLNMSRYIIWFYVITLTLLEIAVKTKTTVQGKSHGIIQESVLEGVTVSFQEFASNGLSDEGLEALEEGLLAFDPPALVFGARQLGVPHGQRVLLTNKSNVTLRLTSISGNTMHFHSSFFENKMIPPQGNTSFSVVFLGRERGYVDTNLYIHTSIGTQKYAVSGVSVLSDYRLQPLVGVKLPQNASFSPLIYLHNPHDHPIQITEVYSSGGGVSLELPGGVLEGPQTLWRVPPHSTRPVVAVRYTPPPAAQGAHPHTAYVRIKVNGTSTVLVVAVEVQASAEPGPYAVPHCLDFGMGGTKDPPKQVAVYLGNSSPRWVRVASAAVRAAGGAAAVSVALAAASLPPRAPRTHVATLTVHWRDLYESGQCCGEVILRTKQGQHKLVIPYTAHPLLGGLVYNHTALSYLSSELDKNEVRKFTITNGYSEAIYITDIITATGFDYFFKMTTFKSLAVSPGENATLFTLQLLDVWDDALRFESKVVVVTNISTYDIPIYIYNGKLDVILSTSPSSSEEDQPDLMDLGLVGLSSTTRATVWLDNANPVPVCLDQWGLNLEGGAFQFLGCLSGRGDHDDNITACTCIPSGARGAAALSVVAPAREATVAGALWLATRHQRVRIAVRLRAARGRLDLAAPLLLEGCFAGTTCSQPLLLHSSFPLSMSVLSVAAVPGDPRIFYRPLDGVARALVLPQETNELGRVYYDPLLDCREECYTGLDLNSTEGAYWVWRSSLAVGTRQADVALANAAYALFLNLTAAATHRNFTLRMDTSEVRNYIIPARITFTWPRLSAATLLEAPLAQVGRAAALNVTLRNPSHERALLVHLVAEWALDEGMEGELHSDLLPPDCPLSLPCASAPARAFHFPLGADDEVEGSAAAMAGVRSHAGARAVLLPPAGEVNVSVEFEAESAARLTSLLYLRNNLTVVEVIRLVGQGAHPSLKFGNRKPGSSTPLLFELTDKHLKDCDKERTRKLSVPPNLTVKRSFTARNTGDITILITNFFINGFECEGYGFKVLNCSPFELKPNATHKVDIAFTPDFTLAKIHRTLIMLTSLDMPVNYSLVTTVPAHLLAPCGAVLTRPDWESLTRNMTVSFMVCLGVCILAAGFFESDRILKMAMAAMTRDRSAIHMPLDLRSISHNGTTGGKSKAWEWNEPSDKKQPVKLPQWSIDSRRYSNEDSKLTKYEEVLQTQKNKKKSNEKKRCANIIDAMSSEILPERDSEKEKTENVSDSSVWRNMFSRSSSVKSGDSNKNSSNLSENCDTSKLIPSEEIRTKQKMLDIPKKIFNLYSGSEGSGKSHLHHGTKRHSKNKCREQCCEEDTSSTATESSNNDEVEKDVDVSLSPSSKQSSTASKKSSSNSAASAKKKCPSLYKDSYEGDGEDEEYDHKSSILGPNQNYNALSLKFQKIKDTTVSSAKFKSDIDKQKPVTESPAPKSSDSPQQQEAATPTIKNGKNQFGKSQNLSKKEKQLLSKKRSLDKSFVFGVKSDHLNSNLNLNSVHSARISPPSVTTVPSNCWGENRATFSDVVARSDNSLYSTVVAPRKSDSKAISEQKMTKNINNINSNANNFMYNTDNGKKQHDDKTPLGPIGSSFYQKRSPLSWGETPISEESNLKQYSTMPLQQPITKPLVKAQVDDVAAVNNNSFFYFGNGNNVTMNENAPVLTGSLNREVGVIGKPQTMNYGQYGLNYGNTGILEERSLVDGGSVARLEGTTAGAGMGRLDFEAAWDNTKANIGLLGSGGGNACDNLFNDYRMRTMYADAGQRWGNAASVWEQPSALSPMSSQAVVASQQALASGSGEKGAAEWLWGYSGTSGMAPVTRPPPGFTQPPPHQAQNVRPFDPFQSLSSIWSPGSSLDRWTNGQDKKDNGSPSQQ